MMRETHAGAENSGAKTEEPNLAQKTQGPTRAQKTQEPTHTQTEDLRKCVQAQKTQETYSGAENTGGMLWQRKHRRDSFWHRKHRRDALRSLGEHAQKSLVERAQNSLGEQARGPLGEDNP